MALADQSPAVVLFLLLPLTQVLAQGTGECSVGNDKPTINENNLPEVVVTTITMNPGVTVTIETSEDSHWFKILGTDLILTDSLDYEKETVLLVTLLCQRDGVTVNSVNVIMTVGNLNDNSPEFKETNITESVPEDAKVNTTIIAMNRVTASDADLDVIYYELVAITPAEATDYFNIQGVNNPTIYLRKSLDYDQYKFMQLLLYAKDSAPGNPDSHVANATINIDIQQVDTRPPWFQPCTFINVDKKVCISSGYIGRVNISEKTTDPLTLKPGPLYAIDPDYTLNEKIVYSIVGGNKDDIFLLNSDTGNITMNKAANTSDTFILQIMATQANNVQKYSLTTVEIKVIIKSSFAPLFVSPSYTGTVSAGLATHSLVMEPGAPSKPLKIFAADDDFPNKVNPQIVYNIKNSSDFTVTRDGLVLTNTMLPSATTITMLATAMDEESLQEANTMITVEVTPSRGTTPPPIPTTITTTSAVAAGTGTTTPKPSGSSLASSPGAINTASTASSGPTKSPSSVNMTTNNAGISGTTGKPVTDVRTEYLYTSGHMAALGVPLAVLLAMCLLLLGIIIYKNYGTTIKSMVGRNKPFPKDSFRGVSNNGYLRDENLNGSMKDSESLRSDTSEAATPVMHQQPDGFPPLEPAVESSIATTSAAIKESEGDKEGKDTDSDKEVKSILTKDRRTADEGYKAVWFKEDIDPDTKDDVVVIEDQVEETDSDEDNSEGDEQNSLHNEPGVSFIPKRVQLPAKDANLSPGQDTDTGDVQDDIL
nr:cadherin-related family member 5 isoform X3 [Pelodiscus sinensis]|eukprot:XP_006124932.1 cadherin-related family member 5 isoform X3 [Pelodiscus sinensis]